eukprot:178167-Chlamydomonas_euryale.AAC.1
MAPTLAPPQLPPPTLAPPHFAPRTSFPHNLPCGARRSASAACSAGNTRETKRRSAGVSGSAHAFARTLRSRTCGCIGSNSDRVPTAVALGKIQTGRQLRGGRENMETWGEGKEMLGARVALQHLQPRPA